MIKPFAGIFCPNILLSFKSEILLYETTQFNYFHIMMESMSQDTIFGRTCLKEAACSRWFLFKPSGGGISIISGAISRIWQTTVAACCETHKLLWPIETHWLAEAKRFEKIRVDSSARGPKKSGGLWSLCNICVGLSGLLRCTTVELYWDAPW